jgi:hypothetical protein
MPLSINVGLSRKASRDYQSTGVSINVTAELDATLLANPDELQHQIENLYNQARGALDRQSAAPVARGTNGDNRNYPRRYQRSDHGRSNGNGNHGGNGASSMTTSQRRAIESIARRANIDPILEARDVIGAEFDQLSLRQASELIDHLKAIQPASGPNGH